ncbi:LLM class F420-dependent oxidoreductase [Actinacidiphila oryziradicis]|jgi:probable F420-dependent oxidoreductase|uniref:LLM class F420-dependent oxidoreductase n=1 Tax=Actinacidiphila oryziradicis TaxID=2571141 RepID=UPI0023F4DA5B|nr:LLM class F420-dependent oxidoreductase [Actinacidiphila oryziradicis]MCW2875015.1 Rif11-like protein [Actinacidiphila oryziradicis]
MARRFRFGVNFLSPSSGAEWTKKCRHAETLGYDVLLVPDHLGWPAPFPSLVAAAQATERPRVGTFVLNAAFWNPVLLAREVATTDQLTGGRLELGLGAGYVRAEFEQAGLEYGSPRDRADRLERTVEELDRLLSDEAHEPASAQRPRPPLLLGGNGNRLLRLAARHADIVAFTGGEPAPGKTDGSMRLLGPEALADRVATARRFTAEYGTDPELNVLVQRVVPTSDRAGAARELQSHGPDVTPEQLLDLPTLLIGTVKEMAGQLRRHREQLGLTYITVMEPVMEDFAPVIEELRRTEG